MDLTTHDQIFCPPTKEEWFKAPSDEGIYTTPPAVEPKKSCDLKNSLHPRNMLPYLSPRTLFIEEEREKKQEYRNWGEYVQTISTSSLDQWQGSTANLNDSQYEPAAINQQFGKIQRKKKSSVRKPIPSQTTNHNRIPSSKLQYEPAASTQPFGQPHKVKKFSGRNSTTDTTACKPVPLVQPSTSRDVVVPFSSSSSSANRYVIPKKGIQSNKLNELATKVPPPARPILPKPPIIIRTSPPRNISGYRSTQGQKKKK